METSSENKTLEEIVKRRVDKLIKDNSGETKLDLRGLNLTYLPDALLVLEKHDVLFDPWSNTNNNLEVLDLSDNKIASLPVLKYPGLVSLNLSNNKLISWPDLLNSDYLKSLNLANNNLTVLPEEIGKLTHLESLDLSGNQIDELPPEITKLKYLKTITLTGNPLSIPLEILEKVTVPSNLFEYYFDKTQERLLEAKILFVGQGGVGKTSIIHRILDNT